MSVRFTRPVSRSAFLSRYFGSISFALVIITFILHRIGIISTPDFFATQFVAICFALVGLLLAAWGLRQLWVHGAQGGKASLQTLFLIALPLAILAFVSFRSYDRPALYDVTTDVVDVPQWLDEPKIDQKWLTRPSPVTPAVREAQREFYPEFASHRYEGAIDRVYAAVRKVARAQKITIREIDGMANAQADITGRADDEEPTKEDEAFELAPDELPTNVPVPTLRPLMGLAQSQAEPTSESVVTLQGSMSDFILGLPYHLVIRLQEDGLTTLVDMRIAADYGSNDYGFGVMISKSFLAALDAEMQGLNDL